MKYLLRILVSPLIFTLVLAKFIYHALHITCLFIRHGGEWITYDENINSATIRDVYEEMLK